MDQVMVQTKDHQRVLRVPRPGHLRLLLRPWIIRGTYWDHGSSEDVIATSSLKGVWVHECLWISCMWWGFRIILECLLTFRHKGVTKRCRLAWRTNSALVYEPNCGGGGELRGLSQWVKLYTGTLINFGALAPNLNYVPTIWMRRAYL